MIQPNDMKGDWSIEAGNGAMSANTKVWEILVASYAGDQKKIVPFILPHLYPVSTPPYKVG